MKNNTYIQGNDDNKVASFAEAWIENFIAEAISFMKSSPPSRRRGLKRFEKLENLKMRKVASFAEAWIEILLVQKSVKLMHGRLLRGGVH